MDIATYKLKRAEFLSKEPKYRTLCTTCKQPDFSCYCRKISSFDPKINFVILIHPVEAKRRIATGRMSHLSLKNSHLIQGQDYSKNDLVNELLADTHYNSFILYPGHDSKDISLMSASEKQNLCAKKMRVFVIDGTWATARKMIRQSKNLHALPRLCFVPNRPSNFRVRKQPRANCYSTIEAIHHTIELVGESQGFAVHEREHDKLLSTFNYMVETQLGFIRESNAHPQKANYRREGQAKINCSYLSENY